MIFKDLLLSLRYVKKNKFTSLINVLGLTIGITGCLVTYLVVLAELSYDKFHPSKDRIYRIVTQVGETGPDRETWSTIPYPAASLARNTSADIEALAVFIAFYAKVSIPFKDQQVIVAQRPVLDEDVSEIVMAEPSYFDIFEYKWLAGNQDSALLRPFSVVLTESKARSYFGGLTPAQILGKEVLYNDSLRTVITGVVEDWKQNSDFVFSDFISFATINETHLANRSNLGRWDVPNRFSQTFVKLKKTTLPAQLGEEITESLQTHNRGRQAKAILQPLAEIHFDEAYRDMYSGKARLPALYTLLMIAFSILALAIVNFINLATAQSSFRAREMIIKKILGATKRNLMGQFLIETGLLSLFALGLSVLLTNPVLSMISGYVPKGVGLYLLDIETVAFILAITLLTTVLAGWYPASVLASISVLPTHRSPFSIAKTRRGSFRKGLIIFQFSISVIFIVSALVVGRQLGYMLTKPMGFDKKNVVSFSTPGLGFSNQIDSLAAELRQSPGVAKISLNMGPPLEFGHRTMHLKHIESGLEIEAELHSGDENYLALFNIPLLAGRNYATGRADSLSEFVVNESAVKMLGYASPREALGAQLTIRLGSERKGLVVGVVNDFHSRPLQHPISPAFFIHSSNVSRSVSVKLDSALSEREVFAVVQSIEKKWQAYYPNETFEYSFLEKSVTNLYKGEFKTIEVLTGAMVISLFISCLGLYGVVTFVTERRAREIGIRKVIGASELDIVMMLSKEFIVLIAISIVIGSPLGFLAMSGWLKYFAYAVELDFWIFVAAGLIVLLISLATLSIHSVRVAKSNPVESLKTE